MSLWVTDYPEFVALTIQCLLVNDLLLTIQFLWFSDYNFCVSVDYWPHSVCAKVGYQHTMCYCALLTCLWCVVLGVTDHGEAVECWTTNSPEFQQGRGCWLPAVSVLAGCWRALSRCPCFPTRFTSPVAKRRVTAVTAKSSKSFTSL